MDCTKQTVWSGENTNLLEQTAWCRDCEMRHTVSHFLIYCSTAVWWWCLYLTIRQWVWVVYISDVLQGERGERRSPTIFAGGTLFPLTKTKRGGTPSPLTRIKPRQTPFITCDVLFELSELSETLQHRSMYIVKADRWCRSSVSERVFSQMNFT